MKNEKVKLLILGVTVSLVVSATPALASTNTDSTTQTITKTQLKNDSVSKRLKDAGFITKKSKVSYKRYTYATAPTDVKAQYEADCKAANKTPNPTDLISVPILQSLSINSLTAATVPSGVSFYVGYNSSLHEIRVIDDYDNAYYTNINTDYVGYNHITSGQAVVCLQALLNEIGYSVTVDGYFGPQTQGAVIDFQKYHGLSVDGVTGPNTWNTMLAADGF